MSGSGNDPLPPIAAGGDRVKHALHPPFRIACLLRLWDAGEDMVQDPPEIDHCPACGAAMDVRGLEPLSEVACPHCAAPTLVKRAFGPYTLLQLHAMGGMSQVFLARDHLLDREVALKVLGADWSMDAERIAAFDREARVTAALSHPNIVRVLRTGIAYGRFYIAMEFVPGGHLENRIRTAGRIPEDELLALAVDVAHGLRAAHLAGLIHRDVKPGNILIDAQDRAKLVDFGLALVTQGGLAHASERWATPYYAPPETIEGAPEDFRSDLYAFGATLYHALAGTPPCALDSASSDELLAAKRHIPPLASVEPSISPGTCRIVDQAMAWHPGDRFAGYDEMIAALSDSAMRLKSAASTPSVPTSSTMPTGIPVPPPPSPATARSSDLRMVIAAVVAVVLAGWWFLRDDGTPLPSSVPAPAPPTPSATVSPVAGIYNQAHAALKQREYDVAAAIFEELFQNESTAEPTRTMAGLESVICTYSAGRPRHARARVRQVLDHVAVFEEDPFAPGAQSISPGIVDVLKAVLRPEPVALPAIIDARAPVGHLPQLLLASMTAALKNWEQGMLNQAVRGFEAVVAWRPASGSPDLEIYRDLAQRHLEDFKLLQHPCFTSLPADRAGCDAALKTLAELEGRLATSGRARFNLLAWRHDIERHARLLK